MSGSDTLSPAKAMRWSAAALALSVATLAHAALGERLSSVEADRMRLAAAPQRERALMVGTVVSMRTPDGTRVQQFVDADGVVYAVSWHAQTKPRLDVILGRHFADYQRACHDAQRRRPGLRHNLAIDRGDLVVQSVAHLNAHVGRAYLKSRVPPAADIDAIR
jgi:hypothetical protein